MKIQKKLLASDRHRKVEGGFSYIPNRFLTDGFFSSLSQHEKLIYFLLVLVSDRDGLSYYSQDRMSTQLELSIDEFIEGRNGLIEKSLIAFDGLLFQVLSLPDKPVENIRKQLKSREDFMESDRFTMRQYLNQTLRREKE